MRELDALGGDHAVSFPLLRAYGEAHPGLTVLHIDAHPDLYDEFDGDRLSHACPFVRALEEGRISRLVQVGIRTLNPVRDPTGITAALAARLVKEILAQMLTKMPA